MSDTLSALNDELARAERVAVLAVGSELRGDDAVGLVVGRLLETSPEVALQVFHGATAPENCSGAIKKFAPSHLVIIDAADLGRDPGSIELLNSSEIAGISFATHSLPLTLLVDYLRRCLPACQFIILGIQPQSLAFGAELTPTVADAAERVKGAILESVRPGKG